MKHLKLIVTTDIHGTIYPTNYTSFDNVQGYGLSRISTAIKQIRQEDAHVLLLDNGDSFQGTPLLTYALKFKPELLNPMAQAFNSLNYDYINLGNHDFNYGEDQLLKFINDTDAQLLTSNVIHNGTPIGSTQIITVEGKKIALIGVLTHYIPNWEQPDNIVNFDFKDAYTTMDKEVQRVQNDVDLVIGMYHGGLEQDPITGEPTERLTGENQGYKMTSIEGLDILITGHQHRSLVETINSVIVSQSTLKGEEFIIIDIDLGTKAIDAVLHSSAHLEPDTEFLAQFATLQKETQAWLDEPIGFLKDGPVLIDDEFDARLNKHPLVSLINQVQMDRTKTQLASSAIFNGVVGFNQNITMRDLVTTYLYPNTAVVKKLTGKQLREMLEFSANYFTLDEEGNITYSPEFDVPKPQHYNYDMVDGIDYTIKVSNPRGSRIVELSYEGNPVKDDDTFTLAVNNYRAMGGGNYTMVAQAETLQEIQEDMQDTLMQYLLDNPEVTINHKDNIKVIK